MPRSTRCRKGQRPGSPRRRHPTRRPRRQRSRPDGSGAPRTTFRRDGAARSVRRHDARPKQGRRPGRSPPLHGEVPSELLIKRILRSCSAAWSARRAGRLPLAVVLERIAGGLYIVGSELGSVRVAHENLSEFEFSRPQPGDLRGVLRVPAGRGGTGSRPHAFSCVSHASIGSTDHGTFPKTARRSART